MRNIMRKVRLMCGATGTRALLARTLLCAVLLSVLLPDVALSAEQQRGRRAEVERRRVEAERQNRDAAKGSEPNRRREEVTQNRRENEKGKDSKGQEVARADSSNGARREAMRRDRIPTSQQPVSQSRNESGREYSYEVARSGGGTERKSVQDQTRDHNHSQPHWEAGRVKTNPQTGEVIKNKHDRPALQNGKSKVEY